MVSSSYYVAFFAFVAIRCSLGIIYKLASSGGEFSFSPNSAIVLAETVKFMMSMSALKAQKIDVASIIPTIKAHQNIFGGYLCLAFLYYITNQIVFYAISLGDPFYYELFKSTTPFVVLLLLFFFTTKPISGLEWASISIQTGCLILLTVDTCKNASRLDPHVLLMLIFAVINTSISSIINEKIIKGCSVSLHFQNAFLYFFGIVFNLMGYLMFATNDKTFFEGYLGSPYPILVVIINACFGLAITAVYKYCDVIAKTFASSAALCLLQYVSWMFFGLELNLQIVMCTAMTAVISIQYFVLIPKTPEISSAHKKRPRKRLHVAVLLGVGLFLFTASQSASGAPEFIDVQRMNVASTQGKEAIVQHRNVVAKNVEDIIKDSTKVTALLATLQDGDGRDTVDAYHSWHKTFPTSRMLVGCDPALAWCKSLEAESMATVVAVDKKATLGLAWNMLLKTLAPTDFFLLVDSRTRFENVELSHMLTGLRGAAIVTGSFKNQATREVRMNCKTLKLEWWTLYSRRGYRDVLADASQRFPMCAVCDSMDLPFLANVSVVEGLGFFDEALPAGVVTDFFLRAKHERSGVQAASCPLSYFQKTAEPKFMDLSPADKVEHVKTLVPLGKKYLFDKIEAPSGADIWICRSDHSMGLAPAWFHDNGVYMPRCMYQATVWMFNQTLFKLREKGIDYVLSFGPLAGAVKMAGYLPWDMDVDVIANLSIAQRDELKTEFEDQGFRCKIGEDGVPNFYFDGASVWISVIGNGYHSLKPVPEAEASLMQFNHMLLQVPANPFKEMTQVGNYPEFWRATHESAGHTSLGCNENFKPPDRWGGKNFTTIRSLAGCIHNPVSGSPGGFLGDSEWDRMAFDPENVPSNSFAWGEHFDHPLNPW